MTQISATRTRQALETLVSQAPHTENEMFGHFGIVFSAHILKNYMFKHFGIVFRTHMLKNKMFEHLSSAGVVAGDRIGAWRH